MIHQLKTQKQYFDAILSGAKTFEARENDRDFQVGDFLALNEVQGQEGIYTGRCCIVRVTYILSDWQYTKQGFVIMAFEPCMILCPGDKARGGMMAMSGQETYGGTEQWTK